MGHQKGGVHISGKFGDIQYTTDGMQGFVKVSNPPSREKIMKDPSYAQLRKNMAETKGASLATDALQLCFGEGWNRFGERYLRSRLQTLLRGILVKGTGFKGERKFEVAPNLEDLQLIDLDDAQPLTKHFKRKFTVSVNPDRNTATVDVPGFIWDAYGGMAPYATHGRLFMTIGVLTDFEFVGGEQVYASSQPTFVGLRERFETAPIPAGPVVPFQMVASLPGLPVLPSDTCLVVCIGVQYMQVINNREEIFAGSDAMQVYAAY